MQYCTALCIYRNIESIRFNLRKIMEIESPALYVPPLRTDAATFLCIISPSVAVVVVEV